MSVLFSVVSQLSYRLEDAQFSTAAPVVSVVVPARNEADELACALEAVLVQADEFVEIIVVDGGSTDTTAAVAAETLSGARGPVAIVENPAGTTPSNLNAGLAAAHGRYICRVDARSHIPPDYLKRCVAVLDEHPEIVVVGGAQVATPRSARSKDLGIARALNNRFGMGLSRYRRAARSGPADTVYLGVFRANDLRELGGWDERFTTNQDFELNRRLARRGDIWFEANLNVKYLPRATIRELFDQYQRFGRWKVAYWRIRGEPPRPRQKLLLAVPFAGIGGLVLLSFMPRKWRLLGMAMIGGMAGLIEVRGSKSPSGPPAAHLYSLVASMTVAAGWTTGVWRQLITDRREMPTKR